MLGKSAILDGPDGTFVVTEADVPEPDPNGILMRQELCGICGTDAYVYRGGLPGVTFPIVLGHETVGVVERLGANIREDSTGRSLAEGDRVYIQPGYIVPAVSLLRRPPATDPLSEASRLRVPTAEGCAALISRAASASTSISLLVRPI
jgi:NADPH:quinone reductase-like Zn-dependent oxidoreductase